MSLVLNNGSSSVTFLDAVDGFTNNAGQKYWTRAPVGDEQYAMERTKAAATAGKTVARHDFDHRDLGPFLVFYIGVSSNACWTAYDADALIILNKALTVTVPNYKDLVACSVEKFRPASQPQKSGAALFRMAVMIELRQDRNS